MPAACGPPVADYAFDDALIDAARRERKGRVRVYRVERPTVVIGRGGGAERELFTDAIAADDALLLRRRGGGCAVVLDPGNVIVSVALPIERIGEIDRHFRGLSAWMSEALARLGAHGVARRGVSDLALGERKLGGSCMAMTRDLLYYSTTILVAPDVALMERYLRHPPREPGYRRGRPHRDFVAVLSDFLPHRDAASVEAALAETLTLPAY